MPPGNHTAHANPTLKESDSEWVFPKVPRRGKPEGPRNNFDKALRKFVAKLPSDIKPFMWHDLRRTCGCRLLQDYGLSMELVSTWLGHSSITVTERHYAFLKVDHLQRAIGAK